MERNATPKIDSRIPLDKAKILDQFASLPYMMQVSLLAGLSAGMATTQPIKHPT